MRKEKETKQFQNTGDSRYIARFRGLEIRSCDEHEGTLTIAIPMGEDAELYKMLQDRFNPSEVEMIQNLIEDILVTRYLVQHREM